MSYILDALKKSEQERGQGSTPNVQTVHTASLAYKKEKKPLWPYVLIVAVILNLIVISYFIYQQNNRSDHQTSPISVIADQQLALTTSQPPVSSNTSKMPISEHNKAVIIKPLELRTPQMRPKNRQTAEQNSQPSSQPSSVHETTHVAAITPETKRDTSTPEAIEQHTSLNIIDEADLPDNIKQSLPSLVISAHVYSSQPAQRSMVINDQFLEEGDYILDGLSLYKITPQGAIFHYRNYYFRNRTVSSWQ